jgi:hypothetical protein
MGTVTEEDLYDAEVTSVYGTVRVKLDQAKEAAGDVVYTRDRRPLWPILLAAVIAVALVVQGSFAVMVGLVALLLLLVREVQR